MNDQNKICRSCIDCAAGACDGKNGMYPDFCPTAEIQAGGTAAALCNEAVAQYLNDPEDSLIAKASAAVEFENYCKLTRVEEICEFADKIGAHKLGIAACVGLLREARTAAAIFRHHGFEVFGAAGARKIIYRDNLYIILNDEWYNAEGKKVGDPRK